MLKVVHNPKSNMGPSVVVLGMFDGVHIGHQALLQAGRKLADQANVPLCVCTFEPHPLEVLMPARAPRRLTLPEERNERMAAMQVDRIGVHDFTRSRAAQAPEDFLAELKHIYQPLAIVCGYNFTFGDRGMGNPDLLRIFGAQHGIQIVVIEPVLLDGFAVSSTRIRQALTHGDMEEVTRLLGAPFMLGGQVTAVQAGLCLRICPDAKKACPADGTYIGTLTCESQMWPVFLKVCLDMSGDIEVRLPDTSKEWGGQNVCLQFERIAREHET